MPIYNNAPGLAPPQVVLRGKADREGVKGLQATVLVTKVRQGLQWREAGQHLDCLKSVTTPRLDHTCPDGRATGDVLADHPTWCCSSLLLAAGV